MTQVGKDATYTQPDGTEGLLNDRPSLVLEADIIGPSGATYPVTAIVNHLRSLSGIDSPADGARVRAKRRAQAEFLANYIQARQEADPGARIVSVGDYNAFQFSDGYVDSLGTITGVPTDADHVVLASADLVIPDLANLVELAPASERYSFVFNGNPQLLDHVLATHVDAQAVQPSRIRPRQRRLPRSVPRLRGPARAAVRPRRAGCVLRIPVRAAGDAHRPCGDDRRGVHGDVCRTGRNGRRLRRFLAGDD